MPNLRRTINRISISLCLLIAANHVAAQSQSLSVDGVWSLATRTVPASVVSSYGDAPVNTTFIDFGGKYLVQHASFSVGGSLGLYSGYNSRGILSDTSAVSIDFMARSQAQSGNSQTFLEGYYRFALGWVPLQVRVRKYLGNEWLYTELGTGPAYGFGAMEYSVKSNSIAGVSTDVAYHKYSEWGWITSLTLGADFQLNAELSLQIFSELAYLHASIKNPDLLQAGSFAINQWFLRPGVALALRF